MEKYVKDAEKAKRLMQNQAAAMQQYLAYFKENFLMINGKPGSGKTYLGLHISGMRVMSNKKSKIMYLVPTR